MLGSLVLLTCHLDFYDLILRDLMEVTYISWGNFIKLLHFKLQLDKNDWY